MKQNPKQILLENAVFQTWASWPIKKLWNHFRRSQSFYIHDRVKIGIVSQNVTYLCMYLVTNKNYFSGSQTKVWKPFSKELLYF